MPYIKEFRRAQLATYACPDTSGELNYCFTQLIRRYLADNLSYTTINDVVGALECAKIEFYRRVVSEYEDKKIKDNGDVY